MEKILLVDGHNLLFKMFFGIPNSIKNSKGKEIRGLVGFLGNLKKVIHQLEPDTVLVLFDSETSKNENVKWDQNYKGNRKNYDTLEEENNPFYQLPMIYKALDYLNIFHMEVADNEADDYIASFIYQNKNKEYTFIILSTDSDLIQLVDNKTFLYVERGKRSVLYTLEEVVKKYNVTAKQFVEYKALVGDKSDNITGVPKIGKCTAQKILMYGSIQDYKKKNPETKLTYLLEQHVRTIDKNKKLITLSKNIDISQATICKLDDKICKYKTYEIIDNIGER